MRQHHCGNFKCQTTNTPLWRKGWIDPRTGKAVMLCNACGLHFKKGHFCLFCNQIYRECLYYSFFPNTYTKKVMQEILQILGLDVKDVILLPFESILTKSIGSRWTHRHCEIIPIKEDSTYLCVECRQLKLTLGEELFNNTFPSSKKRRRVPNLTKSNKKKKITQEKTCVPPPSSPTQSAPGSPTEVSPPQSPLSQKSDELFTVCSSQQAIVKHTILNPSSSVTSVENIIQVKRGKHYNVIVDNEITKKEVERQYRNLFSNNIRISAFDKMRTLIAVCETEINKMLR